VAKEKPAPEAPEGEAAQRLETMEVAGETIPLPPEELWRELDNSGEGAAAGAEAPPKAPEKAPEVATLDFVGDRPEVTVPLRYPFRLDGRPVEAVTVRELQTWEVGAIARSIPPAEAGDLFHFYAAMTGLPAPVLRALPGTDGERVTGAAWAFLPRMIRGADDAQPIPDAGDA